MRGGWDDRPKTNKFNPRKHDTRTRESRAKTEEQKTVDNSTDKANRIAIEQAMGTVEGIIAKDSITAGLQRAKEAGLPLGMIVRLDGSVERVIETILGHFDTEKKTDGY